MKRLAAGAFALVCAVGLVDLIRADDTGKVAEDKIARDAKAQSAITPAHFTHGGHAARGVAIDSCESCHRIDAKGQILAPAAQGHAPCLQAQCHASDFLAVGTSAKTRKPVNDAKFAKAAALCLGCHDAVPWPWKKAPTHAKPSWLVEREHHVEMNHYEHTLRTAKTSGCRGCHIVDDKSFALVVGTPGHAQCVQCHNAKDYPEFTMSQCGLCHGPPSRAEFFKGTRPDVDVRACGSQGEVEAKKKQRPGWTCFKHERVEHRVQDGQPVECVACHYIVGDKQSWGGRRYQTLKDLHNQPIIYNRGDKQHDSCGKVAACHKRDVDPVSGAKCNLCHAEKSVF